jgi:GrpB-like predicted nucleotidyltransferase (UPF0157 family)
MPDERLACGGDTSSSDRPDLTVVACEAAVRPLADRLTAAGIADHADPVRAWQRLRDVEGRRATLIDLYQLVAASQGLTLRQLPREQRRRLAEFAFSDTWPGFSITTGSNRRHDPIEVVEYDPAWPSSYKNWQRRLLDALGAAAMRIEHVGSTAVPGLSAKPVIDIQISVADLPDESRYVPQLEAVGVQLRSRDQLHRYFRPIPSQPRETHVHVCELGSTWEREHLLFRDYLRAHPAARDAYADTKRAAARTWHDDRWAYTEAKTGIILDILEAAERWAHSSGWETPPRRERA